MDKRAGAMRYSSRIMQICPYGHAGLSPLTRNCDSLFQTSRGLR